MLVLLLTSLALVLSCSAPVPKPTGPAADYQDAKDMFKRSRFDRALEFSDGLASATPATKYTERAQVLRVVIFTGQLESCKDLAEAYAKGADATKNAHFKAEYERLRHDNTARRDEGRARPGRNRAPVTGRRQGVEAVDSGNALPLRRGSY